MMVTVCYHNKKPLQKELYLRHINFTQIEVVLLSMQSLSRNAEQIRYYAGVGANFCYIFIQAVLSDKVPFCIPSLHQLLANIVQSRVPQTSSRYSAILYIQKVQQCLLTFPRASVQLYSHADRPGMFAVWNEAHPAGDEWQLESLPHHKIGITISRQDLKIKAICLDHGQHRSGGRKRARRPEVG